MELLTCHRMADILNDPKQKLFRPCTFQTQQGAQCNYPVLVSKTQQICNGHVDLVNLAAKREHRAAVARKRKATTVVGPSSTMVPVRQPYPRELQQQPNDAIPTSGTGIHFTPLQIYDRITQLVGQIQKARREFKADDDE